AAGGGRADQGHLVRSGRPPPPGLSTHPRRATAAGRRPGGLARLRLRGDRDLGAFMMTSPLIAQYVTGLHQSLPADIADAARAGLLGTSQDRLDSGASDQEAAHAALAEFGDLTMVVGEFTRQAPGRHAARLLLATGPVVGACWAAALVLSRAWTWPLPTAARLSFGAVLLLAVPALALAPSSQRT